MKATKVTSIYRHLVKGFQQEALETAELVSGASLLGDRAFAFQFLDTLTEDSISPENDCPWTPKTKLAVQHDWPDLALLIPSWNDKSNLLKISISGTSLQIEENVTTLDGRKKLADFVSAFLKNKIPFAKAKHPTASPLRLIGNANFSTRYTDGEKEPLSIGLRESILDLESTYGFAVDERRFRLNLFLEGAPPWSELSWAGKKLRIGECLLEIYKPLARCPNIDVDQKTGNRRLEIFPDFKSRYGHSLFGVKAHILKGGTINSGDSWELFAE